jgi:serine/threonine-protein kinase RsbW
VSTPTTGDPVSTPDPDAATDLVELRVPADPAYLTVVRTASAGLAARLDLTLDEIEDLRIAVDEACTLLLGSAPDDEELVATFRLGEGSLEVEVRGPARELPERSSFAWAVLEALVGEVFTGTSSTGAWIVLRHSKTSGAQASLAAGVG